MRSLLVVAMALALSTGAFPQEPLPRLSVITYNVQYLPGMAGFANKRKQPDYRAKRIAEEMSAFDIVALQETFNEKWRPVIVGEMQRLGDGAWSSFASPKPADRMSNGGCLLMTRLGLDDTSSVIYGHFSTAEEYGVLADGPAAKGVIHGRIAVLPGSPSAKVDVFVTHMEARAPKLRPFQYLTLAEFIRETGDADVPALLMGDLNTGGLAGQRRDPDSQYALLMAALRSARPEDEIIDVWPSLMGDAHGGTTDQDSTETGNRIDYVILMQPKGADLVLRPVTIRVEMYQDPRIVALSDHNAVIVEFEIVQTSP